jgi:hypothetical protein
MTMPAMRFWFFCLIIIFISAPESSIAATFTVSTAAQFQNALTNSASNGENDVINVSAGTYVPVSTLTYDSAENKSLTISGAGAASTIIDGGSAIRNVSLRTSQPSANLVLKKMMLRHGQTTLNGGGFSMETNGATITVSQCAVEDNAATTGTSVGGGGQVLSVTGSITVTQTDFRRNNSTGNVGGLYGATTSGTINLGQCTFEQNSVNNTGGSEYFGDGGGAMLYSDGITQFSVSGNTFLNNTASGGSNPDGGGIMTYQLAAGSVVTIESTTFSGNQAGLGGGGCFVRLNAGGAVHCRNNIFSGNQSLIGNGAAVLLYVDSGTIEYSGNSSTGNLAAEDGGGAWIDLIAGDMTISGNRFSGNSAGNNGGGISLIQDSGTVTFTRNICDYNTSGNVGGGVSFAGTTGTLNHTFNTYYQNTAGGDGGGVFVYFDQNTAQINLSNSILRHDQPNEFNYASGSGTGSASLTWSNAEGSAGEPWFGIGCIDGDPLFSDAAAGDFRLTWSHFPIQDSTRSPCIDSGDPGASPDSDGTRSDMGALFFDQATAQPVPVIGLSGLVLLTLLLGGVIIFHGVLHKS